MGAGKIDSFEGQEIYVSRALRVSRDGKTIGSLAKRAGGQNAAKLIWTAHDGGARILLGVQNSLYYDGGFWTTVLDIDLASGKERVAVSPVDYVFDWYADGNGAVRMGYGYEDQRRIGRIYYRPGAKGGFKTINKARFSRAEELTFPALFLSEPGKALAYDDSTGFTRIREYDLETQEMGKDVFGTEGYDVDAIISNTEDNRMLGVSYTAERVKQHWFDPELAAIQADLDKASPGLDVRIVSMNRDSSRMLVHIGAPDRMGAYYVFDRNAGKMALFALENEALQAKAMAPVKTIHYKARDGIDIQAVLTLPRGREPKSLPLVLMPHGGPNARDYETWDYWAQFVASRGYAVIQPNYRGSTGLGQAFADLGDGEWGLKMQDDLNDAVDHLAKSGIADPKRVCIVGGSYGGYAAMYAAGRDPGRFRCAVSFAGVSDLVALKRFDRTFLNKNSATDWLESRAADLRAVSPIGNVERVSVPLLLVHGKKDLRVPVAQSRSIAEALEKSGKTVRYIELPEGDHNLSRQDDRVTFLTELAAFLVKYNPAD